MPLAFVRLEPAVFRGVVTIAPGLHNCVRGPNYISCSPPTVLSDNNTGPANPDLFQSADIRQFVAWINVSDGFLYVQPASTTSVVSTIHFHLDIDYSSNIGVPNFEITGITSAGNPSVLSYEIINNGQISQKNKKVIQIIVRLQEPAGFSAFYITWNYNNLQNVIWMLMSELTLCNDFLLSPHTSMPAISFQYPVVDNTILITTQNNETLTLNCTVSHDGHFVWRWKKIPYILSPSDTGINILTTYATRASIITIQSALPGFYQCEVSYATKLKYFSRTFVVSSNSKLW